MQLTVRLAFDVPCPERQGFEVQFPAFAGIGYCEVFAHEGGELPFEARGFSPVFLRISPFAYLSHPGGSTGSRSASFHAPVANCEATQAPSVPNASATSGLCKK